MSVGSLLWLNTAPPLVPPVLALKMQLANTGLLLRFANAPPEPLMNYWRKRNLESWRRYRCIVQGTSVVTDGVASEGAATHYGGAPVIEDGATVPLGVVPTESAANQSRVAAVPVEHTAALRCCRIADEGAVGQRRVAVYPIIHSSALRGRVPTNVQVVSVGLQAWSLSNPPPASVDEFPLKVQLVNVGALL